MEKQAVELFMVVVRTTVARYARGPLAVIEPRAALLRSEDSEYAASTCSPRPVRACYRKPVARLP
jgi:hypothetical protein